MSTALEQRQEPLPQVVITGDLRLSVTESEAAHGPITGHYSIETRQMQGPLQVYWGAEGQVTDQRTSIVTGVFVQILVTADTFLQVSASA